MICIRKEFAEGISTWKPLLVVGGDEDAGGQQDVVLVSPAFVLEASGEPLEDDVFPVVFRQDHEIETHELHLVDQLQLAEDPEHCRLELSGFRTYLEQVVLAPDLVLYDCHFGEIGWLLALRPGGGRRPPRPGLFSASREAPLERERGVRGPSHSLRVRSGGRPAPSAP
ncbi:hypothetical protein HWI79_3691 [Cryptosporidium felis]|nr:hypothetical protein HWI79_3691 [Cryptosporidium felis]